MLEVDSLDEAARHTTSLLYWLDAGRAMDRAVTPLPVGKNLCLCLQARENHGNQRRPHLLRTERRQPIEQRPNL